MACDPRKVTVSDLEVLPTSRSAARASGASHYFTGVACKHGHIDKRLCSTGACAECIRVRQRARLLNPEYRAKHNALSLKWQLNRLSDVSERKRVRDREREVRRASPERIAKKAVSDRIRNQRDEVRAAARRNQLRRYHEVLRDDKAYRAEQRERSAKWARENRDRCNAKTAARRAARIQATPPWLTAEMHESMGDFYARAQEVSSATGVPYEVDHIVPLNGEAVCGLHVPWNLQILSRVENRAKSNRMGVELVL